MQLQNKNILLISPEPWDHIFVSKHHYAIHLGIKGNKVFFLNPPLRSQCITPTEYENVFSVTYTGFPKGLRFFPTPLQKYFIRKRFEELQKLCHARFDIIWSFDNSVFFDFSALPSDVLKINHIVDLSQNFQTEKAAKTADICFACAQNILSRLKRYQSNVYKINHGVPLRNEILVSSSKRGNNVTALYAGNLDIPYIDWDLLLELVRSFSQIDFIFVGPMNKDLVVARKLQQLPNVNFVGAVPFNDLQKYYADVDVLLITYKADQFKEQVSNTHKVMDYFASGKVTVATFTEEYIEQSKEDLLAMSSKQIEFIFLFEKVINNLNHWNSEILQRKRRAFAADNSYPRQIDRIETLINQHLNNG